MLTNESHTPIFITGVERSGIILMARILQSCGVFFGNTTEKLENKKIKELVDNYYKGINIPINGQYPLPNTEDIIIPSDWENIIIDNLQKEGYSFGAWGYQSSRIAQIWPIWSYTYPNAKWIIVRRQTGEIINSCMQTAYMDVFKNKEIQSKVGVSTEREGWLWHIHQYEHLFVEMINSGVNCQVIFPERMINGDYRQLFQILDWTHLKWNNEIINLVNPFLNKERSKTWQE